MFNLMGIIIGSIIILYGILCFYRPFIKWQTKLNNKMSGVKTEISKTTIIASRFQGLIAIFFGLLFILLGTR